MTLRPAKDAMTSMGGILLVEDDEANPSLIFVIMFYFQVKRAIVYCHNKKYLDKIGFVLKMSGYGDEVDYYKVYVCEAMKDADVRGPYGKSAHFQN